MQETEETDEASALARAREKRKLLLAKRNNPDLANDDDEEESEKVPPKQAAAINTRHSRKDSVASSVSSISAGPLTPASASGHTFHFNNTAAPQEPSTLKTTATFTNQDTATATATKKIPTESSSSDTKRPKSLDQFFEMRRHKDQQRSAMPPTPPSSPLHRLASKGGDMSVAEESLLPYSSNSVDGSIGLDLASLDGTTTVSSLGPSGALLKGYQEKLSKQLSELQHLCEQDNHVDNDEHSTYTNPESRTRAKQENGENDDDASSSSDSSGNLLMQASLQSADIRLTGRSLVVDKTEDESSVLSQAERLPSDRQDVRMSQNKAQEENDDGDDKSCRSSSELQRLPADLRLTDQSVVLEEERSQDGDDLPQSEPLDSSKQPIMEEEKVAESQAFSRLVTEENEKVESSTGSHASMSQTTPENEDGEPSIDKNAPPASQAIDRGMPKEENDKALAEMKTPKKSNRSSPETTTKTADDDDDSLEDLYRTDKWGRADMKGEAAEAVVEDNYHVSTTAKVALATVAVVAGFCMRTFSRHRG